MLGYYFSLTEMVAAAASCQMDCLTEWNAHFVIGAQARRRAPPSPRTSWHHDRGPLVTSGRPHICTAGSFPITETVASAYRCRAIPTLGRRRSKAWWIRSRTSTGDRRPGWRGDPGSTNLVRDERHAHLIRRVINRERCILALDLKPDLLRAVDNRISW